MPAESQVRRTYRGEEEWFELLEEAGPFVLRKAFIAAGETPTVAGQLVWFLEDQRSLDRHLGQASRHRYRCILDGYDLETVSEISRSIPRQFNPQDEAA